MGIPRDNLLFGFAPKLTEEQKVYADSIYDNQVTFVNARSGTGKTTIAVAVSKLLGKELVYVFAPTEEGQMGFRPGTQNEKEAEYLQPIKDALIEIGEDPIQSIYDDENIDVIKAGKAWVRAKSHIFVRGTNIKDSVVIIGEAQNYTKSELRKVLTRIHDSCTVIVEGHTGQCDLDNVAHSGFAPYIEHFRGKDYAQICELSWNFRGKLANDADELT